MSLFTVPYRMRRCFLGPLMVLLCGLTACASNQADQSPVSRPAVVIERPGKHLVTVTERDNGATIVLDAAQELSVRLPIDGSEVTAGFDWLLVDVKDDVLSHGPPKFEVTAGRDLNPDGVGGEVVWLFVPQPAATTPLRFEFRRLRSRDPATRVVSFTVKVK